MLFRLGIVIAVLVFGTPAAAGPRKMFFGAYIAEATEEWVAESNSVVARLDTPDKKATIQIIVGADLMDLLDDVTDVFPGKLGPEKPTSVLGMPGGTIQVSSQAEPTADEGAGFVAGIVTCRGPTVIAAYVAPGGSVDHLKELQRIFESLRENDYSLFPFSEDARKLPQRAHETALTFVHAVCANDITRIVGRVHRDRGLKVALHKQLLTLTPAELADAIAVAGSAETFFSVPRGSPWELSRIDEDHFRIERGSLHHYVGFARVADTTDKWVLDQIGIHSRKRPDAPAAPVVTREKIWNGHYTAELPAGWKEKATTLSSALLESDDGTATLMFLTGPDLLDTAVRKNSDITFGPKLERPVLGVDRGVLYLSENVEPTPKQSAGLIAAARPCVGPTTVVGRIKWGGLERARQARAIVLSLRSGGSSDVFVGGGEIDKLPASARAAAIALAHASCAKDGDTIAKLVHPRRGFTVADRGNLPPETVSAAKLRGQLKMGDPSLWRYFLLQDDGPWDVRSVDPERSFELVRGLGMNNDAPVPHRHLTFERVGQKWMLVGATWKQ